MVDSPFSLSHEALPETLAVFPLPGALLLPGQDLPLNIFEPRYLAMVLDALGEGRHIGMVQPDPSRPPADPPPIYGVGCAGRITMFRETDDGRLLINLAGVCRFESEHELDMRNGYRRVRASWSRFAADVSDGAPGPTGLSSETLEPALRAYLDANGLKADLDELRKVEPAALVAMLSMRLPLRTEEKQALLEADSDRSRAAILLAALELGSAGAGTPGGAVH